MAYIYKIVNDINNKIYIGKTEFSIQKRFYEHCRDSQKILEQKRPLYAAMRKYGLEHFYIELIEETNNPEEREKYWIEYYQSFKNGYNATMGGDGKRYLDYDLILATFKELQNCEEVAKKLNCCVDSVKRIIKLQNVFPNSSKAVQLKYGVPVNQYDLNDNFIQTFPSYSEAAKAIGKNATYGNISRAARGKRKTAYGYKWKDVGISKI